MDAETEKQSSLFIQRALLSLMNHFSVCVFVYVCFCPGPCQWCVADHIVFGSQLSHLLTRILAFCEITWQDNASVLSPLQLCTRLWMLTLKENVSWCIFERRRLNFNKSGITQFLNCITSINIQTPHTHYWPACVFPETLSVKQKGLSPETHQHAPTSWIRSCTTQIFTRFLFIYTGLLWQTGWFQRPCSDAASVCSVSDSQCIWRHQFSRQG